MKGVNRTMVDGVRWTTYALMGVLLVAAPGSVSGQVPEGIRTTDDGVKYARGQNIVPVFEGWVPNEDGTFSLVFGYFNRNWEEDVFIPVGPGNHIEPGGPDLGQPTVFTPRRERNRFEVVVPKDFGTKEVVWTVTHRGKTEKAYGALIPAEILSRKMVLANVQREFTDDDNGDATSTNTPPKVDIAAVPPVTLPAAVTLNVSISDDAVPMAGYRFGGGRGVQAIKVNWTTYRGPALASFEPASDRTSDSKGGKISTAVRLPAPGTYVLRATVVDIGGYLTNKDITIVAK